MWKELRRKESGSCAFKNDTNLDIGRKERHLFFSSFLEVRCVNIQSASPTCAEDLWNHVLQAGMLPMRVWGSFSGKHYGHICNMLLNHKLWLIWTKVARWANPCCLHVIFLKLLELCSFAPFLLHHFVISYGSFISLLFMPSVTPVINLRRLHPTHRPRISMWPSQAFVLNDTLKITR